MKKQALILIIVFLMILASLASLGCKEINRASANSGSPGWAATATSAAGEFHVQLTLSAREAAQGLTQQTP
jgi:hypothetical protein